MPRAKRKKYRRWTREKVLHEIQWYHQQGILKAVDFHQKHAGLSSVARNYFGHWHWALVAAQVLPPDAPPRIPERWSQARILEEIHIRHRQSRSLYCTAEGNQHLYDAACRHFGSWRKALKAAGFLETPAPPPPAGLPPRLCSRQDVIEKLRLLYAQDGKALPVKKQDGSLVYAAKKYFGRWQLAVQAAGIPDARYHRLSPHEVLETIRNLKQQGHSLRYVEASGPLRYAAMQHFGSWREALGEAGVWPNDKLLGRRKWNREHILGEIRDWHHRVGKPSSVRAAPVHLCGAAKRHFGSWDNALLAAGLPPLGIIRWSAQRVIDELRTLFPQGITEEHYTGASPKLVKAAYVYFGGWRKALLAAQILTPSQKLIRKRKWTRHRIIETIQDRYIRGLSLSGRKNPGLSSAAIQQFGRWDLALQAAGIPPEKRLALRRRWSQQHVIEKIQCGYRQGLTAVEIHKSDHALSSAAVKYFGGWHQALIAAGLLPPGTKSPVLIHWSRQQVIEAIQACYRQAHPRVPDKLYCAARRHFGSWRKARVMAGIHDTPALYRKRRCQRVIEALRAWGQAAPSLSSKQAPSWLISSAYRYWGGWHKALVAVGLRDKNSRPRARRTWNPQQIIAALQQRQQQGLGFLRVWKEDPGLYKSARRYFGRWQHAVSAAGFDLRGTDSTRQRTISKTNAIEHKERRPSHVTP